MLLDRKYQMKLGSGKLSLVDDGNASYETLSNGEKRRLDLAIQFGLHDYVHTYCGLQLDTLFIDEVLDTLDAVGISNIIDILRIKLSYCNLARIFIITHNTDLKSYFDRVLLVTKDAKGFSNLQII
jgi:DNA repair exonuclease SbcCD ATPase subunit